MFLKDLTISAGSEVIRSIKFHEGMNLIVDETSTGNEEETGNNVGKTTVLMLIDFCLGSSGKGIYTDPENKKEEYKKVKEFLIDNQVLITLTLKEDLSKDNSPEIRIERNFLARKNIVRKINSVPKTEEGFEETLTNYFFPGHYGKKPTLPQIISHNIRYKDLSLNNTLKTLDMYTSDAEYETLYLFLLGCQFNEGDAKQEILSDIRTEQAFKTRLEKEQTLSAYETALSILESEIGVLNKRKSSFNTNQNFENDLNSLNQIKYKMNVLSSEIGKLTIRRDLIQEAKTEITSNESNIDLNLLKQIYFQATSQLGKVQKTFEELYAFHNRMVTEKINFISKDLPQLENALHIKSRELGRLLEEENKLTVAISKSDSFEELENVIVELNEKFRKKGEYVNTIEQLRDTDRTLSDLTKRLNLIDDLLFADDFSEVLKEKVNKFNRFFSRISHQLYGEQYALKVDPVVNKKGQRLYKFSAFNTNFSSGKKQGEITCFDIAYTLYADEENIPCLHFLLNDKKELMHDNQLVNIAKLVNGQKIQFVASILKDKLPAELNREGYFVVKLSQADKLFRIENYNSTIN